MNYNGTPEVGQEFELLENGGGKPIDQITIIGTVQHPDGRLEIRTKAKKNKSETEFGCDETLGSKEWLVLHRDPMTNERCFSSRGPRYSLRPIQKN